MHVVDLGVRRSCVCEGCVGLSAVLVTQLDAGCDAAALADDRRTVIADDGDDRAVRTVGMRLARIRRRSPGSPLAETIRCSCQSGPAQRLGR
jgi:hypothetical protein